MPTAVKLSSQLGFPNPRVLEATAEALKPEPGDFWFQTYESPIEPHSSELVEWYEELPIGGMTAAYTIDTDPAVRKSRGRKHHLERTLYWKETAQIEESAFLRAADEMRYDQAAGKKLIMSHLEEGDVRLHTRIEWLIAKAYQNGFIAINEEGVVRTVSYGYDNDFNLPTVTVDWRDPSADIVGNLQAWIRKFRGYAKRGVRLRMNGVTAEAMMRNQHILNLFRQSSFAGELGKDNIGKLFRLIVGSELTDVQVYDEGYFDDEGDYNTFLDDGKVLLLATPPKGNKIGAFKSTPSVSNGGGPQIARPGKILGIDDQTDNAKRPRYETTHGIYGIPIIKYVKCVQSATVFL